MRTLGMRTRVDNNWLCSVLRVELLAYTYIYICISAIVFCRERIVGVTRLACHSLGMGLRTFGAPLRGGCHGNGQSPPAECVRLPSGAIYSVFTHFQSNFL
jgi:hypothetical protein